MTNLLNSLNNIQQQCVTHITTPLLIIAGAGSGKTRVITHKIVYLINSCNFLPSEITAITFTNKAAKEMLDRVQKLSTHPKTNTINILTFHALGLKILRHEHKHLNLKSDFTIYDYEDSNKIIQDITNSNDKILIKSLKAQISAIKNSAITLDDIQYNNKDYDPYLIEIFCKYQQTLQTYHAIDLDDLIYLPLILLNNNLEILFKWQKTIKYLLVDEYQDTNECQYQLIKLLVSRNLAFTVVGDDDQSIYGWRGANSNNLIKLNTDFPELLTLKLEQNYRSTNTILAAANTLIKNNNKNFDKKLWSSLSNGNKINIIACKHEEHEAETIAKKIWLNVNQNFSKFSNHAILYRGNHQAKLLEQALRNLQIPYTISGGQSFFDSMEIKDISAYLRLLVNEDDNNAFIRVITTPKRGIGDVTLKKLINYANSRNISLFSAMFEEGFLNLITLTQANIFQDLGKLINNLQFQLPKLEIQVIINEIVKSINYESYLNERESIKNALKRMQNISTLAEWLNKKITQDNKNLGEMVQLISLINLLNDEDSEEINAVKLSTLHAAKGLEFENVYIISCNEGILPHQESINNNNVDEERRLMYVGITRAKQALTISYCLEKRARNFEDQIRQASRFINELGDYNIFDNQKLKHEKLNNIELESKLSNLSKLLSLKNK